MMPDMSGSSPLLHSQGIPAPHSQPNSLSQARSGWFSQTHPTPKQMSQSLFIAVISWSFLQLSLGLMIEFLVAAFGLTGLLPQLIRSAHNINRSRLFHFLSR
jgi:hypothetical protein